MVTTKPQVVLLPVITQLVDFSGHHIKELYWGRIITRHLVMWTCATAMRLTKCRKDYKNSGAEYMALKGKAGCYSSKEKALSVVYTGQDCICGQPIESELDWKCSLAYCKHFGSSLHIHFSCCNYLRTVK
jgi:hypothetical protein